MSLSPKRERAPVPKHPYRTSAIVHAGFALVIVAVALLTGGGLIKAIAVAAGYFVIATGWTWWKFRRRIAQSAEGGT